MILKIGCAKIGTAYFNYPSTLLSYSPPFNYPVKTSLHPPSHFRTRKSSHNDVCFRGIYLAYLPTLYLYKIKY